MKIYSSRSLLERGFHSFTVLCCLLLVSAVSISLLGNDTATVVMNSHSPTDNIFVAGERSLPINCSAQTSDSHYVFVAFTNERPTFFDIQKASNHFQDALTRSYEYSTQIPTLTAFSLADPDTRFNITNTGDYVRLTGPTCWSERALDSVIGPDKVSPLIAISPNDSAVVLKGSLQQANVASELTTGGPPQSEISNLATTFTHNIGLNASEGVMAEIVGSHLSRDVILTARLGITACAVL